MMPAITKPIPQAVALLAAACLVLAAASCDKNKIPAHVSGRVLWEDTDEPATETEVDLLFSHSSYENFTRISAGAQQVPIAADGSYSFVVPEMAGSRPTDAFSVGVAVNPDGGASDTMYYCSDFPVPSHIEERFLCNLPAEGEYDLDLILRR